MFITFIFILFLVLILLSLRIKSFCLNEGNNSILDKNYTTQIRGIAILLVIISHLILFVYLFPNLSIQFYHEKVIMFFIGTFTNVAVGIFLFLSGYGNYFSIKKQENKNKWIVNKLIKIYVPVGILIILSLIIARFLNLHELFPHWWTPIRNFCTLSVVMWSFGYLKVQAMSYCILFFAEKYFYKYSSIVLISIFIVYLIFCLGMGADSRWWFTSLCFPLGYFIAKYKDLYLNNFSKIKIWINIVLISLLILMLFLLKQNFIMIFISLLACIILTKLSAFWDLKSKLLNFMGNYSLELYLIHLTLIPLIRNLNMPSICISKAISQVILILLISLILSPILRNISNKLIKMFIKEN